MVVSFFYFFIKVVFVRFLNLNINLNVIIFIIIINNFKIFINTINFYLFNFIIKKILINFSMFKKDNLYRIENGKRVYDSKKGDVFEFTYSEICVNFQQYMNLNTKIFYLSGQSKHNFSLNEFELNYLYTFKLRWNEPLKFVFSKNIEIVKKLQKSDLFFLTNLKNCEFVYLLPRLDVQNRFYFDLVLGVKTNFNLDQIYNWVLKSIHITNVVEINNFNLDCNYIKKIFNFENCKFRDNTICKEEFDLLNYFSEDEDNIKQWGDKNIKKITRRLNYKFIFKEITNHCYWYNNKVVYSDDADFFIDYGWDSSVVFKKNENGYIEGVREYMFVGGLLDTFEFNNEFLNFSSLVLDENL